MQKAIIFDCFGVLITDALAVIVAELQLRDPAAADNIIAAVRAASAGTMAPEASRAAVAELLGLTAEAYAARIRDGEVKNHELLAYIAALRPRYKTALLSNIIPGGLAARFTPDELAAHFDVVVASGDIGFAKPEARAYEITADRLGVRLTECVMIDDREDYCSGAEGVGMQAVRYESFVQMRAALARLGVR